MSNLTSAVPGAFAAFYSLLSTAGGMLNPPVSVIPQALNEYEPGSYVVLGETPSGHKPIEKHTFSPASLGSLNQYEEWEFWGYCTVFEGDFDPETRLSDTWALYQNVVMTTYVSHDGGNGSIGGPGSPILGSNAPVTLTRMLPVEADYTGVPTKTGFAGVVEFCYSLQSRITVA
jgi:hypothetical protein